MKVVSFRALAAILASVIACGDRGGDELDPPITVFAAASFTRPLDALAKEFEERENVPILAELGGSLEHARKLTDLGRIPDAIILVDDEVIASLVPTYLDWYVRFATNRMVVAYTDRSRLSDSITAENWWEILGRPDMRVGRADPVIAPAGRHALELLRRSSGYYNRTTLGDTLISRASLRYVRPNATELAALLEAGEVDYILDYESVARQYGFEFVALPNDLATTILYGVSVPRGSQRPDDANAFVDLLLSDAGRRMLRDLHVDVLPTPIAIGTNVPERIMNRVRTLARPDSVR